MQLRYGLNPQQQPAHATPVDPERSPVRLVHGQPSYINMLDALNSWQLVREARAALDAPVATSFKHVSPAGAAEAGPIDDVMAELYGVDPASVGGLTSAYVRARDSDPKCSYGDFIAVSEEVDAELADLLSRIVSDGIIAPGFASGTVATLSRKKRGQFLVMEADPGFTPPKIEIREVYGLRLTQPRDSTPLSEVPLPDALPVSVRRDLRLGLAVLRYTQSNSVAYLRDGMTLGIGAGQQSRIDCTRLAGAKADAWSLRRHPAVRALTFAPETRLQDRINQQLHFIAGNLTGDPGRSGVSLVSDGALPFRDNVDEAHRHGTAYIAEPGGLLRSDDVLDACREHGITHVRTDLRLFHH